MTPYFSTSGKQSGVISYEIGDDFIIIQFPKNQYKYSYSSCGISSTENMKQLALDSCGLTRFINDYDPGFEWKH